MRILFVDTTTDSLEIGGGHLILPALMGELVKRKHEVHLVMAAKENIKLSSLIEESAAIVHIAPWKKKAPVLDLVPLFNEWINKLAPDVYVVSSSASIGWLVLPLLNPLIPAFTIGHNNEETFYLPVRHYHRFLNRAIGVSEEICSTYKDSCSMPSEKVKWIPYGVPATKQLSAAANDNVCRIIYVGRIEQTQKRISDLVTIALGLEKSKVKFRLQIVGDGPELQEVQKKLNTLVEKNIVEFKGWRTKNEVIQLFRQSDVFILTSAYEGFSIALTEAMANGCCPVVSDIKAGNKQLITHGFNGYLVPVADTESYIHILSDLADNPEKLLNMRQNALSTGSGYSIERMAAEYEAEFETTLKEVNGRSRINDSSFPILSTCVSKYPMWIRRIKYHFSTPKEL